MNISLTFSLCIVSAGSPVSSCSFPLLRRSPGEGRAIRRSFSEGVPSTFAKLRTLNPYSFNLLPLPASGVLCLRCCDNCAAATNFARHCHL